MQLSAQTIPVLSFLGVVIQLGGALMLLALFLTLRRYVLRRAYFTAWAAAWLTLSLSILALVLRYAIAADVTSSLDSSGFAARGLYLVFQVCKGLAFVYFLRGTLTYVSGPVIGVGSTRRLWIVAATFGATSAIVSHHGLDEMVIWQSVIAVPALGYCASALLWLPRPRRTTGSMATGACFALLAILWLSYAGEFGLAIHDGGGPLPERVHALVGLKSYLDLALNVGLGYSMILLLMEDAKREVDDAQAELRLTHDRLRRAALYDELTDSLNRRAFAEGVGLEMVRATFGTVVMADLDNLKVTNDRHGHAAGDQLLRRCADVLRGCLRPYDKLYRWGGDEFLIVLPRAHSSDVVDRLRRAIESAAVAPQPSGDTVRLRVSLGSADYASSEGIAAAIERADRAMYGEKGRRKGARSFFVEWAETPTSAPAVR